MKKLFGQMAADKKWQARGKNTSRQCECERNFCCMAEFFRSPRKSVKLKKHKDSSSRGRGCCHIVGKEARWRP